MGASIPVLVHHSIAPGERIGPELFEEHLRALSRSGLPALRPRDLEHADRGFLLTFDDGFADVWTHVLPLLERYRVPALLFAIVSRVGEGEPRPQGVWAYRGGGTQALAESARVPGPHRAFLRWSELQALEATGLVQVQSHSFEHRMGWVGNAIRGFHLGPTGRAHWSLPEATGGDTRLGIPLYPRLSVLARRIYRDDPDLRDALAQHLASRGGEAYVTERGVTAVEEELHEVARAHLEKRGDGGRWETERERVRRTVDDLSRAKETLERRLGGTRDELCLPWGHFDAVTLDCARRAGVRRIYTTRRGPNPAGRVGFLVNRFGPMRSTNRGGWLRSRLWIYRSTVRATLYEGLYGLRVKDLAPHLWRRFGRR
jgi:peptidoglycan/xylan/chitin deacetylase (PgdA/CDA1 family)